VHRNTHPAFIEYQTAAEGRPELAADTGKLIDRFVDTLVAAGWSQEQTRTANIHELASSKQESTP
jgi:hypothetical protein